MSRTHLGWIVALGLLTACEFGTDPGTISADADEDGFRETEDCDDEDATVYPGADELCDEIDNNCNGQVDELAVDRPLWYPDVDGDGYGADGGGMISCDQPPGFTGTPGDCNDANSLINPDAEEVLCTGVDEDCDPATADGVDEDSDTYLCDVDCDDDDPAVNPGATEICNDGIDNDCKWGDGGSDQDGDGWIECDGDCDPEDVEIHPDAVEVIGDATDNDCDGTADQTPTCPCEEGDWACAVDLCSPLALVDQAYTGPETDPAESMLVLGGLSEGWGNLDLDPRLGTSMLALSTGSIYDTCTAYTDPGFYINGSCTNGLSPWSWPDPLTGSTTGVTICDHVQVTFTLTAPETASAFSFDFLFMSSEYPEWLSQGYNDTFLAILEAPSVNGGVPTNISFDPVGNGIEVDNSFFQQPGYLVSLAGTAYSCDAGATGWLRTSWNVERGETFTITFSIHDEGDPDWDSLVLVDNWQWWGVPLNDGTTRL